MDSDIKLIIFDLDGTLVDAYKAVSLSLNHALTTSGFDPIDDYTIQRSVGWGEKILVSKFVPADRLDEVLSVYRVHHAKALKSGTKFLPGAFELLSDLKKSKYRLAIASNRPSRFSHIILKHLKAFDFFDHIICADQVDNPKPASDMLDQLIKRTRIEKNRSLYVGDMTIDVQTAKAAGIKSVCVTTGSNTKEELASFNPHAIITQLSELKDVINAL